jgi:hypothetical protein
VYNAYSILPTIITPSRTSSGVLDELAPIIEEMGFMDFLEFPSPVAGMALVSNRLCRAVNDTVELIVSESSKAFGK